MTNVASVHRPFRALRVAALLAFGISHSALVIAATPVAAVAAVQPTRLADLILLDRGFDAGLREGMVVRVTRGTTEVAEVQLVEIRRHCSAALILSLASKQAIRAGDTAAVKILNT